MTDTLYDALGHVLITIRDPRLGSDLERFQQIEKQVNDLRARVASATTLDGATQAPEPYRRVANAGEFAAIWNNVSIEGRERLLKDIQRSADDSQRCFAQDHDGLKEQLFRANARIIELTTPPEPEPPKPWQIELKHDGCAECEQAAEFAIQNALDTGQDSSYWNVVGLDEWDHEVIHNAQVSR